MSNLTLRWGKVFSNTKSQLKQGKLGIFLLIIFGLIVILSLCSCSTISKAKVFIQKEKIPIIINDLPKGIKVGEEIILIKYNGENNWNHQEPNSAFMKDTTIYYLGVSGLSSRDYRRATVMEIYPLPKKEVVKEKHPEEKLVDPGWKVAAILLGILFLALMCYTFVISPTPSKRRACSKN